MKLWFSKKQPLKDIYKITYIPCGDIDRDEKAATFLYTNLREVFVEANDLTEAQAEFTKKVVLTPHVMIDRITKVISRS